MEQHKTKNDSTWFFARGDGQTFVYFSNPRGRGAKAQKFNVLRVVQPNADETFTTYGYVSDAGGAIHWYTPQVIDAETAQRIGQSYLDAARGADEDVLIWH